MPTGKTHDKITLIITPIIILTSFYVLKNIRNDINYIRDVLIILFSYLFSSFMFNGDLDTNSRPYNRWFLFKMIWIPYQLLFKHRNIFTHGIIIGTIIRIIYLLIIILPILYFCGYLNLVNDLIKYHKDVMLLIIIGLESGSALHTISDKIKSF